MSGKLMFGGLAAVAVMALSADTANAQYVVRHGNHYHNVSPGYGYGYTPVVVQPVFTAPIYTRPIYTSPIYTSPIYGGGFGGPVYGGGYGRPVYGGSFNTVNFGIYRPGFNANFGFVIR